MISPMTKYNFLIYHKDYDEFLKELRNIGLVHIVEKQEDVPDEITEQFQNITSLNKTIRFISQRDVKENDNSDPDVDLGEKTHTEVLELQDKTDELKQQLAQFRKLYSDLEPWGKFSLSEISKLKKDKNITIRLFVCQDRKYDSEWESEHNIFIINKKGGYTYFALVELDDNKAEINAEEISVPDYELEEIENNIAEINTQFNKIEARFDETAENNLSSLELYKKYLIEKIEYDKAVHSTDKVIDDKLRHIEAWCPDEKVEDLDSFLSSADVYFIKSAPKKDDKVPVLLKNKKFHKDFEVLGEMYSLPKYGELDLTPFFAPFYALFFGFCLGDIGYGILLTILAFVMKPIVKSQLRPAMNLVAYLGAATILFGFISGTIFGINLFDTNLPIYSNFSEYFDAQNTDINNILFYLSLALGGIQIIFGLILKAVNETIQFGWKLAVGTVGWVFLLVGMITVFLLSMYTEIPESTISIMQNTILIISGVMILVLNNLKRKIHINIGVGLWNSYNMITGILGDLLSYIRLFALGIASAILGFVFNSLALSMSGDIPVISAIIMIIILVIGHSINLFMSGLGAFVHPMRLTFVEFYKNAGFTGGGKKYKPFKKII